MSMLKGLAAALTLLSALTAASCSSGSAGSSNGQGSEITPEDLLAAALNQQDVQDMFPEGDRWWPYFPEFNVGFSPVKSGSLTGHSFWIAQGYQLVGERQTGLVQTTLLLLDDEAAAAAAMGAYAESNDKGGKTIEGPSVGDESVYFTRRSKDSPVANGMEPPLEASLRFRVGRVVGRVAVFTESKYETPEALAQYAAPVVERLAALTKGDLKGEPLPKQLADLMPPDRPADGVGTEFGSAAAPVESWALIDSSGDPEAVSERLHSLGASQLGLRRYGLTADSDQVIEITVFPLADAKSAESWVNDFIDQAQQGQTLDSGKTGDHSAFTGSEDSVYELQFAKGSIVGDVSCFAPFGQTSSACEKPVRELAERWYSDLPSP